MGGGKSACWTEFGSTYDVPPEGLTFGRAPECDVVLELPQVSRRHATVKREGMVWAIKDLGSSNGTFLNAEKLEPNVNYRLNANDELLLGGYGGEKLIVSLE